MAELSPAQTRALEPQLRYGGIHRQPDRDARAGGERRWWYMLRLKLRRGRLSGEQYQALDRLAERYSHDGSLRLTAGQNAQLHGVPASELPALIAGLGAAGLALGCDPSGLEYNVATPALAREGEGYRVLDALAEALCARLYPDADFALPSQLAVSLLGAAPTPSLPAHPPRKLTVGLALPEDNGGDVYSQDLGFILHPGPDGRWRAQVLVGGGLSMIRGRADTQARLATPLGTADASAVPALVEAAAALQRECLDLNDRLHARLKYLLLARGDAWLRQALAERAGVDIDPRIEPLPLTTPGLQGVQTRPDGTHAVVLPLPAGRMSLELRRRLRDALATVPEMVVLPEQHLLLTGLSVEALAQLHRRLAAEDIPLGLQPAPVAAMSCVGPPTCRLAVTESERALAQLREELASCLRELGKAEAGVSLRLAGCPIGCIRPYAAEIGVVGVKHGRYDLYLGGDPGGRRLGERCAEALPLQEIIAQVRPLLESWASEGLPEERFGDFYARRWHHRPDAGALTGA